MQDVLSLLLVQEALSKVSAMNTRSMPRVTRFVSEFAVIVVGVLAALSVESWRENQTDRGLERRYLEQMHRRICDSSPRPRRSRRGTWRSLKACGKPRNAI